MKIIYEDFYSFPHDDRSAVFQVFPDVYSDSRGYFAEVMKEREEPADLPDWYRKPGWIKQVNRSMSGGGTVRGCHAQRGAFCQGKLVQALTKPLYDVITDARPDSHTFGVSRVFKLDPEIQNQLWVPRGFLHAFVVPMWADNALFEYFCDNVYDKASEFGCNPETIMPKLAEELSKTPCAGEFKDFIDLFSVKNACLLSPKDTAGLDYETWMGSIQAEFEASGRVWYRTYHR